MGGACGDESRDPALPDFSSQQHRPGRSGRQWYMRGVHPGRALSGSGCRGGGRPPPGGCRRRRPPRRGALRGAGARVRAGRLRAGLRGPRRAGRPGPRVEEPLRRAAGPGGGPRRPGRRARFPARAGGPPRGAGRLRGLRGPLRGRLRERDAAPGRRARRPPEPGPEPRPGRRGGGPRHGLPRLRAALGRARPGPAPRPALGPFGRRLRGALPGRLPADRLRGRLHLDLGRLGHGVRRQALPALRGRGPGGRRAGAPLGLRSGLGRAVARRRRSAPPHRPLERARGARAGGHRRPRGAQRGRAVGGGGGKPRAARPGRAGRGRGPALGGPPHPDGGVRGEERRRRRAPAPAEPFLGVHGGRARQLRSGRGREGRRLAVRRRPGAGRRKGVPAAAPPGSGGAAAGGAAAAGRRAPGGRESGRAGRGGPRGAPEVDAVRGPLLPCGRPAAPGPRGHGGRGRRRGEAQGPPAGARRVPGALPRDDLAEAPADPSQRGGLRRARGQGHAPGVRRRGQRVPHPGRDAPAAPGGAVVRPELLVAPLRLRAVPARLRLPVRQGLRGQPQRLLRDRRHHPLQLGRHLVRDVPEPAPVDP